MKGWFVQSSTGPVVASWLALPPWKGRSSEERPDRLSQCQHTLLVAVNSRNLGKAALVGSCCCVPESLPPALPSSGLGRGHARGGTGGSWMLGSPSLWLHPRAMPRGLEAFPWNGRPSPVPGSAGAVPRADGSPSVPPVVMVPGAGMHRSWGPGMRENAGKIQTVEKTPNPQKIQTNPQLLEQQGENLNFLEPSSIS